MAQDPAGPAPISRESIGYLEEVKKGKPRKFAMICKGTSVVSLVVYKKGNVEKRRKEAKESGKGQFYFGVVDGKGIDIRFVLARADGFESPPVKSTVLKSFLDESAELKCKPYFEIIDAPPLVLDEDDPLVARFLGFKAAILPLLDAHPNRAEELNTLCIQIGTLLDQEQPEMATEKIDALASLIDSLTQTAESSSTNPLAQVPEQKTEQVPNERETALAAQKVKLTDALKKLKPLIDNAVRAAPDRKNELVQSLAQIVDEIKQGQLDQAKMNIIALGKLAQGLLAQSNSGSSEPKSASALSDFYQQRDVLEPRFLEAKRTEPDKATKLAGVWDYANAQAQLGNLDKAFDSLKRLTEAVEKILGGSTQTDATRLGIEAGIVEKRKFLVSRFQELPPRLRPEIDKLRDAVAALVPHEDVVVLCKAIELALKSMFNQMQAEIDSAINSGNNSSILGMKDRILASELVRELVSNPFVNGKTFETLILATLDEVEKKLAA